MITPPPLHRAPAFQFYADDFLAGTLDLSQEEVGAYVRLLCHQWNRGSIPVEAEKQQRLAGGSVSVDVLAKFRLQPDGKLVNERLEQERQKQADYREAQRQKGLASAEARRKQPKVNRKSTAVQPSHQPDGQPEGNSPVSSLQTPVIIETHSTAHVPKGDAGEWPRLTEVKAAAAMQGIPSEVAAAFWNHFEAQGWQTKDGLPIVRWQSKLTSWWVNEQARTAKDAARPRQTARTIGTSTPDNSDF